VCHSSHLFGISQSGFNKKLTGQWNLFFAGSEDIGVMNSQFFKKVYQLISARIDAYQRGQGLLEVFATIKKAAYGG
jgi:hypothetical protein